MKLIGAPSRKDATPQTPKTPTPKGHSRLGGGKPDKHSSQHAEAANRSGIVFVVVVIKYKSTRIVIVAFQQSYSYSNSSRSPTTVVVVVVNGDSTNSDSMNNTNNQTTSHNIGNS